VLVSPTIPVDDVAVVVLRRRAREQVDGLVERPRVVAAGLEVGADRVGEVLIVVEDGDDLAGRRLRLGLEARDLVDDTLGRFEARRIRARPLFAQLVCAMRDPLGIG
jgi:hypothetical protein